MQVRHTIRRVLNRYGYDLVRHEPRRSWPEEQSRFAYQQLFQEFELAPGSVVLDIGSGAYPLPLATILTDRYIEKTQHRHEQIVIDQRPFLISDINYLPFEDNCFDFVYCSHLLEHVDNPLCACSEIVRIGKRGYIETPTFGKDMLFAWAKGMHRWHVVDIADRLVFFEYLPRQLEGVRSEEWRKAVFAPYHHPMQEVYYKNPDLFNVMFSWQDRLACTVYYLDGRVEQASFS
jgi:SAM-dependent methyltransferase